jgi:hypothetical protein
MHRFTITSADPRLVVPHDECKGSDLDIQGAFDIMLDPYQIDDLAKNNYTLATETCMYCHVTTSFLLFGENYESDTPSGFYGGEL